MLKKFLLIISLMGLLFLSSNAGAYTIDDLYGTWEGTWSWTSVTFDFYGDNNFVTFKLQTNGTWAKPDDGTLIGDYSNVHPGYGQKIYDFMNLDYPTADVSATIHSDDGINYGEVNVVNSNGDSFNAGIKGLALLENDFVTLGLDYAGISTAVISGTLAGYSISGTYNEDPYPGWITMEGDLTLTKKTSVPEPATMLLLILGLMGLVPIRKRLLK